MTRTTSLILSPKTSWSSIMDGGQTSPRYLHGNPASSYLQSMPVSVPDQSSRLASISTMEVRWSFPDSLPVSSHPDSPLNSSSDASMLCEWCVRCVCLYGLTSSINFSWWRGPLTFGPVILSDSIWSKPFALGLICIFVPFHQFAFSISFSTAWTTRCSNPTRWGLWPITV